MNLSKGILHLFTTTVSYCLSVAQPPRRKKIFYLILIFSVLQYACKRTQKQQTLLNSFAPKVVKAQGYSVPKESMAEPKVIPAGKPRVVRVGKPKIVPTNTNVHPAGIPRVVIAGSPRVCTPGQDSFSLPKKVPAIDSPFIAGKPEVVIAQNPQNISSFSKLQGLKNDEITCLLEDKSGNLWIGTDDGGVSKYDGKSFTHFTTEEGLGFNIVTSMLQDTRGDLWFGTSISGVSKYDGKSFTHFTVKEGLSNNWVESIHEDQSGNLWFGTAGGGVSQYDGKSFTHFTVKEGLSNNYVSSIVEDKNGHLWFGTAGGVSRFDRKSFTHFTVKEGLSHNAVFDILEDKSGNLWFGTAGGVSRFDRKSFTHFTEKEGLSNNAVIRIKQDKNGNLWFGTWDGGVSKYDPDEDGTGGRSFTHFTEKEGLGKNEVRSILEDKRGNLWFGTKGGGVNKYDGKRFTHFTVKEGLGADRVMSMLEDKRGNLWFGTNGGVSKYDGQSFSNFTTKEGFHFVWNMLEDKSGNLWFGSYWGIGKYDGESFTHFAETDIDVKCMMEDKSGNLWLGTFKGGVIRYDGKNFTHFTEKEGLSDNGVRGIVEDKNGNLWFATLGGLSRYNPAEGGKNFINFTRKGGLSDDQVVSILKDKSGNLWFGSMHGGVSKYDGNNFTHFTEKEGLSNNNVRNILEDKSGNLWFGTAFGLNMLEKDKLASLTIPIASDSYRDGTADKASSGLIGTELLFKTYTYEDGFSGINVIWGKTIYEAKDGTIWIAAEDRLTAYHPGEDTPDTIPPNIQLTGLSLFNENISWQNLEKEMDTSIVLGNGVRFHDFHFDSISKWYGIPERLSLAYNNNYLTFQFLGITIQSPKKVKYKFKLEGLDKNWSDLSNRSEANYGNLPHGKYSFKVKAMNGDGYWSNEINYSFTIRPPWWHTWWAYTLFALLFTAFIYALFRYRLNKIRLQHEIVLQQHKASELETQALRAQMNPHFIFNCLSSINRFILKNESETASDYLTKFSRLIRMVLNNSKNTLINLEDELEMLRLYLDLERLRFKNCFDYSISFHNHFDVSSIFIPPLLLQPFAENAIWHGLMNKEGQGILEITFELENNMLNCNITDNGVGRKKAEALKSKSAEKQKSMGMQITAERLALLNKNAEQTIFSVEDLVDADGQAAGTTVTLKIRYKESVEEFS